MLVLNFGKMNRFALFIFFCSLFAVNVKAQVQVTQNDTTNICLFDVLQNKLEDSKGMVTVVSALETTKQTVYDEVAYTRKQIVLYIIESEDNSKKVKRKVLDTSSWQNDSLITIHKGNIANLIGSPLTLVFMDRSSERKGCYPCAWSGNGNSVMAQVNELKPQMHDFKVLNFKLCYTEIGEVLQFASNSSNVYLNDLQEINSRHAIDTYVGKKFYGHNILEEKLKVIDVSHVAKNKLKEYSSKMIQKLKDMQETK